MSGSGGGYVPNAANPSLLGQVPSFAPSSTTSGYVGLSDYGSGYSGAVNYDTGQTVAGNTLDYFPVAMNMLAMKRSKGDPTLDITANQLTVSSRDRDTTEPSLFAGEALTVSAINHRLYVERDIHTDGLKIWEQWVLNGVASSNSVAQAEERHARSSFLISMVVRGKFPTFLMSSEKVIFQRDAVHLTLTKYRRDASGRIVKMPTDSTVLFTSAADTPSATVFDEKDKAAPGLAKKTNGKVGSATTSGLLTGAGAGTQADEKSPSKKKSHSDEKSPSRVDLTDINGNPIKYSSDDDDDDESGASTSSAGVIGPTLQSTIGNGGSGGNPGVQPQSGPGGLGGGGAKPSDVKYPIENPTDEFWQFGFEVTRAGTKLKAADHKFTQGDRPWIGYKRDNVGQIGPLGDAGMIQLEQNEINVIDQFMHPGPNRRWMNLTDQTTLFQVPFVLNK